MQFEQIKGTVIECFDDENFIARLQEKLLGPIISRHVEEAVRAKNQEIEHLRSQLTAVRAEMDNLEQYSRRNTLTISGIPETEREDTDALVIGLAKAAGVTVTLADLDRSHRVGQFKRDRARQIVAKFVSFNKRQELLEARRNLRAGRVQQHPILTQRVLSQTFIAESLTRKNQMILFVARQLRRKGKIHSAWTNNCQIKIRAREGGPTIKIQSLIDIRDIVGDDPDIQSALKQLGDIAAPTPRAGTAPAFPVTAAAAERAPREGAAPGQAGSGSAAPPQVGAGTSVSPVAGDSTDVAASVPGGGGAQASLGAKVTAPDLGSASVSGVAEIPPTAGTAASAVGAAGPVPEDEAAAVSPEQEDSGSSPGVQAASASSGIGAAPDSPATSDDLPATPNNAGNNAGNIASGRRGGKRAGRNPRKK